jgi:hypothetical protein
MGDIDFRPLFDLLRKELEQLSVDKPSIVIASPEHKRSATKKQHRLMRKFLEVLKMPVPSPKPSYPGEMDYINLDILHRVIIEPEFLFNFNDRKVKINFALEKVPDTNEEIALAATFHNGDVKRYKLAVMDVEKVLSNIMHHDRSKRLEHSDLFRAAIASMIDNFILEQRDAGSMYARFGVPYHFQNGLGVIRDLKANQDVGTFEAFSFKVESQHKGEYEIKDIILSGRTEKELEDFVRFAYYYFDLSENRIYNIEPECFGTHSPGAVADFSLCFTNANIRVEQLEADHPKLELIHRAQYAKSFIQSAKEDPLFDEEFERFKEPRIQLIKSSQEAAKKQKVVSMFADIEL